MENPINSDKVKCSLLDEYITGTDCTSLRCAACSGCFIFESEVAANKELSQEVQ